MTTTTAEPEPGAGARTRRAPVRSGSSVTSGRAAALPPAERRAAIIAAAGPLLRSRGHDVTTREIARAAGIAEGTVFRAFPTKQAVIDAVVADACDQSGTIERIRAVDAAAPLEDRVRACARILGDRLTAMIDLMIALRMNRPPAGRADDQHPPVRGTDHASRHRRHRERQGELLTAVTDLLRPDAAHLTCSPERAAHLLRLLTFSGTHRMINDGDPLTPDEVADVVLHGILRRTPLARDG